MEEPRLCCHGRPPVLPWEGVDAAKEERQCYHRRTPVLPKKSGGATMGENDAPDSTRRSGGFLLRRRILPTAGGVATNGARRCY